MFITLNFSHASAHLIERAQFQIQQFNSVNVPCSISSNNACISTQQMPVQESVREIYRKTTNLLFNTCTQAPESLVKKDTDEISFDFGMFDNKASKIQSLIILNNQLNLKLLRKTIDLTQNIVLADGGANYYYDLQQYRNSEKLKAVVGDFDCIRPEVLDYYNDLKVPVQFLSNLEKNDFCKSLQYCLQENFRQIFCFGAFGGRMDQTLSCMHHCEKYSRLYPQLQIFLFGKSNLMYFLKANRTYRIRCDENYISKFGCGIISFGMVENVETKGFKYNLGEDHKYQKIEWGQFISTSNQMTEDQCLIKGSQDLFFVVNYSDKIMEQ